MTSKHVDEQECYVVEIDGIVQADFQSFVEALRVGLQLKQDLPNRRIKLRDAAQAAPRLH
jgi:hypothetical protein